MSPATIFDLLTKGGWGVAALAIGALVYLFKEYKQAQRDHLDTIRESGETQKEAIRLLETLMSRRGRR